MKISVEDGTIVCSLEDKDRKWRFMHYASWIFDGFHNGKLKINKLFGDDKPDRDIKDVIREEHLISMLFLAAKEYDVEIDGEADKLLLERQEALKAQIEAERTAQAARDKVINEERERREKWQNKLEKGCGKCEHKCRQGDDQFCAASGDLLDEKNVPKYVNGRHYMFNYVAFPSGNCPYKTE